MQTYCETVIIEPHAFSLPLHPSAITYTTQKASWVQLLQSSAIVQKNMGVFFRQSGGKS